MQRLHEVSGESELKRTGERVHKTLDRTTLDLLRAECGEENVRTASEIINDCARDEGVCGACPEAVVTARDAEQVSGLLRLANEHSFAVTPRGGGSGLAGGCLPEQGGVVLLMTGMNRILRMEPENMTAVVQPGVMTSDLRKSAAAHNLFYPPDPASLEVSTIGGNAATNAGGPACVKYGVTQHYILGLEAVLPTGRIIRTGGYTRKNVVGYDLTQLIVGSEGTLGVITELVLKLIPLPRAVRTCVAVFHDLTRAGTCVSEIMAGGTTPSAVEFLDAKCLDLVRDMLPVAGAEEAGAMLLIETDGDEDGAERDMERILEVCRSAGAMGLIPAKNEEDRTALWEVRRSVSTRIHEAWPVYVPEDVVVPLGRIAALIEKLPEVEREYDVTVYAFGHSGDGNIHLNITAADSAHMDRVHGAVKALLQKVLELKGVISGEHGIGSAKRELLPMQISPDSIALQRRIKQCFDPKMILNPGKLFVPVE